MKFIYHYESEEASLIKNYLKELDLPRNFVSNVKYKGEIRLNSVAVTVRSVISKGDQLEIIPPIESGHDSVIPSFYPLEVIYEDRDVLVVNKASGIVSIPSIQNPDNSIANHIKGYYISKNYENQVIHIVTRLDRDTTGLMLIAKHRLAHALFDRQIRTNDIEKYYYALSTKTDWLESGIIDAPIARHPSSIITRMVDESGKEAQTKYQLIKKFDEGSLLKLQLMTGRTHQIRVHMQYMGGPLIGDDLYGGPITKTITRQALHCGELIFIQPFTGERIHLKSPLANDMADWIKLKNDYQNFNT